MDSRFEHSFRRYPTRKPLVLALGVALAASTLAARAATIQVTTADDPAGSVSTCTLRQAIAAMNAAAVSPSSNCLNSGGAFGTSDTITFASTVTSVALADQPNNELLITGYSLTILGAGNGGVTVSRASGATNPFRIFHDQGTHLYLTGLTVSNGATTTANARGGAIFMDTGFGGVTLTDCVVSGNSTTGAGAVGGAIAAGVSFNTASVSLINSIVSGNSTGGNNAQGGAIYASHEVYMKNSTVSGNSTSGDTSPGGAIYTITSVLYSSTVNDNSTTGDYSGGGGIAANNPTFGGIEGHNSTISGNSTSGYKSPGGAIDVTSAQTMSYFVISNNSTSGNLSGGGAIYTKNIFVANSVISGNQVTGNGSDGGAIHARSTTQVDSTIQTSTVSDNQASGSGGGLWMLTANIIESTISGNVASEGGGGLHIDVCSSAASILNAYNSTIAFNTTVGAGGGGVYLGSSNCSAFSGGSTQTSASAKMTSTILANTTVASAASADIAVAPGFTLTLNTDHDLIQRSSSNPSITVSNAGTSPAVISLDPKLVVLNDNGCGTKSGAPASMLCVPTHAITCSPPRNAGNNPHNYTDDERGTGYPRQNPLNFDVDIGAFELQLGVGDEIFCDDFDGTE
jgi:CSLREA domain-containing protein